ncbi:DMT family transporter [Listeria kieliensis]|uniref:Membrane protein n=1 Tax=Listeria kieliensis TaxID=1621700 RepID=A0A3D8TTA7_9LIST|nr:DMT family transporter [Listeria kieliensis]RDX02019.1 membrane protein [Listeria kieliensis]
MERQAPKTMLLFMLMGFIAGMLSPIQTSINGKLRMAVGSPFLASFISFLVGTILLFLICLIIEKRVTFKVRGVGKIPFWVFTGGIMGVIFVTSNILLLPILGSAMTVVLAICGQMVIALIIDHFGFFGVIKHPINRYRIIGVLAMIAGILLIQNF